MTAARRGVVALAIPLSLLALQLVFFGMPAGAWIRGVVIGLLTALLAIGMALVYRANRVVNFAQADLGFVPTTLVIGLVAFSGWPYFVAMGLGLLAALVLGVVVEMAIIRRFAHSPRLVLTVATLGLGQLLLFFAVLVPRLWDEQITAVVIDPPMTGGGGRHVRPERLRPLVADHRPLAMVVVALFLGRTRLASPCAPRPSGATGRDARHPRHLAQHGRVVAGRGVVIPRAVPPGRRVEHPARQCTQLTTLVQALAALVIGKMRHLPTVAFTAVALGVLDYGVQW